MLTIYGSTTSPYVRRLRIWLFNIEHEFVNLEIFSGEDRQLLAERNPTLKIPMIEDEGRLIYDSRVIFRYLSDKQNEPQLSWEQENFLTLIDSANDSLVQMLMLSRSDIDVSDDKHYFTIQRERAGNIFSHLNSLVEDGLFSKWDYPAICLYCLIDWVEFRQLHDLSEFNALLAFHSQYCDRIEVATTNPRS